MASYCRQRSIAIFDWFTSKRKPPLDRRQSLNGIPVLHEDVSIATGEKGNAVITIRLKRGRGLLARFQPPVMERVLRLDELGTFVLQQVDGKTSTRDIVERFVAHYKTNRREAELSAVEFLKSLAQRGVLSIAIP